MNNIVAFSTFTIFCSYHLYPVPKRFIKLEGNLISIKLSPSSHPLKPLICFASEFICKWNHAVCDLLSLTSFAQHAVWGLAICISTSFFYGWIILLWMDIPHFIFPFISWWTCVLSTCWLLWIVPLWTLMYRFLYLYLVLLNIYFWIYIGSYGNSALCSVGDQGLFDPCVGKILWRRKWQPTPVFLPGEFHGQRSLVGYSPWGQKEPGMTEWLIL